MVLTAAFFRNCRVRLRFLAIRRDVHHNDAMAEAFDPYLSWLGIRDPQRPPNHYTLLGVALFESDPNVLATAADRQMAHVRTFQAGRNAPLSQRLLNELAAAKVCLLNAAKKAAYDAALREQIAAGAVLAMALPPTLAGAAQPVPAPRAWAAAPQAVGESPAPLVPAPVAIEGGAPPRGFPVSTVLIAVLSLTAFVLLALIVTFSMNGGNAGDEPATPVASSTDNDKTPTTNGGKSNDPPQPTPPEPAPPPDPTPPPEPAPPVPDPPQPMPPPDPAPPPDPRRPIRCRPGHPIPPRRPRIRVGPCRRWPRSTARWP